MLLGWNLSIGRLDGGSLEALGGLASYVRYVAVKLLLGTFLVITLSCDSDSQSVSWCADSLLPDLLVQLWVETHILGSHMLKCELLDGLDCPWRSLLELHSEDVLVQMNCVVTGDNVVDSLES